MRPCTAAAARRRVPGLAHVASRSLPARLARCSAPDLGAVVPIKKLCIFDEANVPGIGRTCEVEGGIVDLVVVGV